MTQQPEHELETFLAQDLAEMASEYERIYKRSTEDPGTAGDEGEEVWAALLRDWLPGSYEIRTKGRVLGADGTAGPQVDILVLRPGYPKRLLDKKLYLAGGVAAVFECKNTLKAGHIETTWANVAKVNALTIGREATNPRSALVPDIYYGLLAHGHSWDSGGSDPVGIIVGHLQRLLDKTPLMRDALSLLCVANLASWTALRMTYDGPGLMPPDIWEARKKLLGASSDDPLCSLSYMNSSTSWDEFVPSNPLGVLVSTVVGRLAFSDDSLSPLANYFLAAGMQGMGSGVAGRNFPLTSQMPEAIANRLPHALTSGLPETDWSMGFNF
ncbi:hypothetical protein C6A86_016795 [Mycobacterium sp. ITM-2016-00316]|uniref:DUF6602 domain-containing protein n=1 Tax=Mycobacterium sp. ITM-2016-00316 TaxID=2099695 RepID=UPI00115981BB|nr:DUF6602 domain-containing protein [Mycobacterium sp. ITM-2016-00316]WNG79927.1 hypothetical protein C6A86_016795 [Mycobacterium sp. ITM-2016-00316]